jgi:DNA-binding transcriptional LysR family regulator
MAVDSRLFSGFGVFAAVLETGNFVRAGEALGLTQSAVSRSIQRLEERLGVRLLERTSKTIRLTEDGERFCEEALPLFSQLGEVAEGMVKASGKARGRLRINVEPSFARLFLAPRIGMFLKAYPDIRLEMLVRDRLGDLVAEGIDAAILFGEPVPSALIAQRLLQVHILTCASREYLACRGRPRKPGDLESEKHECLLFRDPATGKPFPWEFHRGKKRLSVNVTGRVIVNDALTYVALCVAGNGVAQLIDLTIEPLLKNRKLINLFPEWTDELFPLYVYYPSGHVVPAKLRVFLDFLVSALEAERPKLFA